MPMVLNAQPCPSCGRNHRFGVLAGELAVGTPYQYICPDSGKPSVIRPQQLAAVARYLPQGAVHLVAGAVDRLAA